LHRTRKFDFCAPEKSAVKVFRWLVIFFTLAAAGCATLDDRPPPPAPEDIVALARSGAPAQEIIRRIQESGAVYPLSASALARLRGHGVPDEVIDYMQRTYVEAVRREEAIRQSLFYGPMFHPYGPRWPPWW
jgi:hypothetical protein